MRLNTNVWVRRLRGVVLVILFISVFLYIFSLNFRTPPRMDFLQRSVTETVSPPIQFFGRIFSSIEEFIRDYIWLKNLRRENEVLRKELADLEGKITTYHEAHVENLRLRRLLDFRSTINADTVAAQVLMHDMTGWFQTMMIDKGSRDGIAPDMAVVNDEGVIGRILDVSDRYCRVLLITDPGSSVDGLVQRNRVRGILTGKDSSGCLLKYVRANLDIQVGDLLVSSGKDGIYPKGLRLGVVQAAYKDPVDLFQKIEVRPLVRLSALEEVLVIRRAGAGLDLDPPEAQEKPPEKPPEKQSEKQPEKKAEKKADKKPEKKLDKKPEKPPVKVNQR